MAVPKFDELFNPLLQALHNLGGSAIIQEIEPEVAKILHLTEKEINEIHRGSRTKLNYRLAWARNYLKNFGLLENSSRGVWSLTQKGIKTQRVDKEDVKRHVNRADKQRKAAGFPTESRKEYAELWKDQLIERLMRVKPEAFERLCQRILRESGFVEVTVTGRSGDGGIDGWGKIRVGGLLSFNVIFQCKRRKEAVSAKEIRDFKGAMSGRTDKGLFITTGRFTREAKNEAYRAGPLQIDLIDGDILTEKMKELELGVIVRTNEIIEVNEEWFSEYN